jgi:hypothetical protein
MAGALLATVVLSSLIVPLAFVTELVLGGPAAGVPAASVLAAQSAPLSVQSERAQRQVVTARGKVLRVAATIRTLDATYKAQLGELEKLSRQRTSWNRDRKIARQKAASQVTAKQLLAAANQLRAAKAELKRARQRLLAALERELTSGEESAVEAASTNANPPPTTSVRLQRLVKLRDRLRRELRPKPRKIVVPDIDIDPADDPDDLAEKAQILARVEAKLRAEQAQLDKRYTYYARQERLRIQRERANEIDRTENDSIRRNPTGGPTPSGAGDAEADPDGDFGNGGGAPPDASRNDAALEASSVILADVVDDVTASDLRRASRSTNPATRARAARQARNQVSARLERLRRTRLAIERRARALRK